MVGIAVWTSTTCNPPCCSSSLAALKRCVIEELPNDADVRVDVVVSAKADDYVMDKREFEMVINGYEDVEGEEGDGEEEFVMHMPDDWG